MIFSCSCVWFVCVSLFAIDVAHPCSAWVFEVDISMHRQCVTMATIISTNNSILSSGGNHTYYGNGIVFALSDESRMNRTVGYRVIVYEIAEYHPSTAMRYV